MKSKWTLFSACVLFLLSVFIVRNLLLPLQGGECATSKASKVFSLSTEPASVEKKSPEVARFPVQPERIADGDAPALFHSAAERSSVQKLDDMFSASRQRELYRTLSPTERRRLVKLKSRFFLPSAPDGNDFSRVADNEYYLTFSATPGEEDRAELAKQGVRLVEHITRTTWRAVVDDPEAFKEADDLLGAEPVWPVDKWSPLLWTQYRAVPNSAEPVEAVVVFTPETGWDEAAILLQKVGAELRSEEFGFGGNVSVTAEYAALLTICGAHQVSSVAPPPPPNAINNVNAAALSNMDDLQTTPYGLTGTNISVVVRDGGEIHPHPDFGSRVTLIDTNGAHWHSTHVAGTIGGSGEGSSNTKGMAPDALIYSYDFYDDNETELQDARSRFGARISNHSYGHVIGWDDGEWNSNTNLFGDYSSSARDVDQLVCDAQLYIFKSAGNDRNDTGTPTGGEPDHDGTLYGDGEYYDCMEDRACAKNIVTVGAVSDSGVMSSFSNFGPTDDGRIKPDIVANGVSLYSPSSATGYSSSSGTSMSSPAACGAATLLLEQYKALKNDTWPSAALLKGLLIQTAGDVGRSGPDYAFGWGLLDAKAATDLLRDSSPSNTLYLEQSLSEGETNRHELALSGSVSNLRITVYWTDVEGSSTAADALVNDLDIVLISPDSNTVHYPYVMPFAVDGSSPTNLPLTGTNQWDNIEQIEQSVVTDGVWTVEIRGSSIPSGPQDYVLFVNQGDLDYDYHVISPQTGDVWHKETTQTVQWTTGSTNGLSRISLHRNGSNVLTIATNISKTAESHEWVVPEHLATSIEYIIRLEDMTNSAVYAQSDVFTIREWTPYFDSFESGWDIWTNVAGDDFDWSMGANGTPSSGTGPSTAPDGDSYAYMESSSPNYPDKTALLQAGIDFSDLPDPNVDFAYHMYGTGIGSLHLEVSTNGWSSTNILWSLTGNQGDQWFESHVSLSAYAGLSNVQIRFRGVVGNSWASDMALDAISISPGSSDIDGDGIPNDWETQYFGGATNANASATCSNGVNTVLEAYVAGLNPTNPASFFVMTRLGSDAGDIDRTVLQWDLVSNRLYTIYWTSNLLSGFPPLPLASNIAAGAFTDTVHEANDDGFYRIEVDLAP